MGRLMLGLALLLGACGGVVVQPPDGVPEASPTLVQFDPVATGRGSVGYFDLMNRGQAMLAVNGITASADIPPCFRLPDEVGLLLPPGSAVHIPVGFKPESQGTFTGQMTLHTSSVARPDVVVELQGTALAPTD